MGSSGRMVKRLASGPTLLLAAEFEDAVAAALLAYDPALRARRDRIIFGNGVKLYGPIGLTAELAARARLTPGTTVAYYADVIETGGRGTRSDQLKWQDAERLVRGLAARLGGAVHDERPPMALNLSACVYSGQPLAPEQVISVLQPYADDRLFVDEAQDVPGAYLLVTEADPRFLTVYWPPRLSRSPLEPPPLALGVLRDQEVCRWELRTTVPADSAGRAIRLTIGEAALALAARVDGMAIDQYGFPVSRPEDLLAR